MSALLGTIRVTAFRPSVLSQLRPANPGRCEHRPRSQRRSAFGWAADARRDGRSAASARRRDPADGSPSSGMDASLRGASARRSAPARRSLDSPGYALGAPQGAGIFQRARRNLEAVDPFAREVLVIGQAGRSVGGRVSLRLAHCANHRRGQPDHLTSISGDDGRANAPGD